MIPNFTCPSEIENGYRHGAAGDRPERDRQRLVRCAVPDVARRAGRLSRGADERAAAAPRPQPDGRGPLDRGAELQRAGVHPRARRVLHRHDALRPLGLHGDRAVRTARRRNDGADRALAPAQLREPPGRGGAPAPDRAHRQALTEAGSP